METSAPRSHRRFSFRRMTPRIQLTSRTIEQAEERGVSITPPPSAASPSDAISPEPLETNKRVAHRSSFKAAERHKHTGNIPRQSRRVADTKKKKRKKTASSETGKRKDVETEEAVC